MKARSQVPLIVARADAPAEALAAFIGQELEHWGFDVGPMTDFAGMRYLQVRAADVRLMVGVDVGSQTPVGGEQ